MGHEVRSVRELFEDSLSLYNDVVEGQNEYSAATLLKNLEDGITNLKENWGGKDAGVQINNIVTVYNGFVGVRNALGLLASSASHVAADYREIQNKNGAGEEQFNPVNSQDRTRMAEHSDNRDTIDIKPDVTNGQAKVNSVRNSFDSFVTNCQQKCNLILENWTRGDQNRESAKNAIENFYAGANTYKELLNQACDSLDTAIRNYNM